MIRHKVVLVHFPFDDMSGGKVRPAVCLTNSIGLHKHVVLAFITSQVPRNLLPTDLVVRTDDPGFPAAGLRVTSTIQLHRLLTVTTNVIQRQLGELTPGLQSELENRLRSLFFSTS